MISQKILICSLRDVEGVHVTVGNNQRCSVKGSGSISQRLELVYEMLGRFNVGTTHPS